MEMESCIGHYEHKFTGVEVSIGEAKNGSYIVDWSNQSGNCAQAVFDIQNEAMDYYISLIQKARRNLINLDEDILVRYVIKLKSKNEYPIYAAISYPQTDDPNAPFILSKRELSAASFFFRKVKAEEINRIIKEGKFANEAYEISNPCEYEYEGVYRIEIKICERVCE